jgi:hypothetical protein
MRLANLAFVVLAAGAIIGVITGGEAQILVTGIAVLAWAALLTRA